MSPDDSIPPPVPQHPGAASAPKKKGLHGCAIAAIVGVIVLVVLIVVAILAGLALPIISSATKKAQREQARALAHQIANSITGYHAEYSRYPIPEDSSPGEVTPMLTDEVLTGALMGRDLKMNPKKIMFLPDLKVVKEGGGNGLRITGEQAWIVDSWGTEFNVIVDADNSGEIDNPNPASPIKQIREGVLVWSSGPDKDPNTWEDNVITWEPRK